jgi:hypothetical protein
VPLLTAMATWPRLSGYKLFKLEDVFA